MERLRSSPRKRRHRHWAIGPAWPPLEPEMLLLPLARFARGLPCGASGGSSAPTPLSRAGKASEGTPEVIPSPSLPGRLRLSLRRPRPPLLKIPVPPPFLLPPSGLGAAPGSRRGGAQPVPAEGRARPARLCRRGQTVWPGRVAPPLGSRATLGAGLTSSESKHLFQIVIYVVSFLLADMDLKDPATLASISNSIIRTPVPLPVKKLYRGEPMALGITQILIGTLEISFGLVVAIAENATRYYSSATHVGTPYWLGILYIISGSLSVAAAKDPKVPLVKGMLAMNVLSSVASGAAIVMRSIVISHLSYSNRCTRVTEIPPDICYEYVTIPYTVTYAISACLMVGTVVEFLITITTAAFGCASVCRDAYNETTVVIFQQTDKGIIPASALPRQSNEEVQA